VATILAVVVGVIFATGVYTLTQRSIVKLVIGLGLLSHAVNLLVFAAARPVLAEPPVVPPGAVALSGAFSDPLPQALVLTAIVISFGVLAFSVVLIYRAYQTVGTDDLDQMKGTDT
jgi:multicomponent Na+:H+ antiporter subunit C